jgi:hypothetical protein
MYIHSFLNDKMKLKNGIKSSVVRFGVGLFVLALVFFGQIASASTWDITGPTDTDFTTATNFCSSLGQYRIPTWQELFDDRATNPGQLGHYYWTGIGNNATWALFSGGTYMDGQHNATADTFCIFDSGIGYVPPVPNLFSDRHAFENLSTVTSDTFSSVLPYLYLIMGLVLAFFMAEQIIKIAGKMDSKYDSQTKEMIEKGSAMKEKIDSLTE